MERKKEEIDFFVRALTRRRLNWISWYALVAAFLMVVIRGILMSAIFAAPRYDRPSERWQRSVFPHLKYISYHRKEPSRNARAISDGYARDILYLRDGKTLVQRRSLTEISTSFAGIRRLWLLVSLLILMGHQFLRSRRKCWQVKCWFYFPPRVLYDPLSVEWLFIKRVDVTSQSKKKCFFLNFQKIDFFITS